MLGLVPTGEDAVDEAVEAVDPAVEEAGGLAVVLSSFLLHAPAMSARLTAAAPSTTPGRRFAVRFVVPMETPPLSLVRSLGVRETVLSGLAERRSSAAVIWEIWP